MADKKTQAEKLTTQEHIPIATVRDGILITKNGGLRVVLLVGAINFSLKSQEEQNSIIYQYQSFINSINFPIQILIQSRIMDLTTYLRDINDKLKEQTNDLLIEMTESYIDFVTSLISEASIMNKRFYVIIPVEPITMPQAGGIKKLFGNKKQEVTFSDKDFDHYREQLLEHAQTVAGGLSSIGLQVAVLNTQQIVELLYTSYNPEEGVTEKLSDVEDLENAIVQEDPAVLQQQVIENMFTQRYKQENQKNQPDSTPLNIPKDSPPVLGGPVPKIPNPDEPLQVHNPMETPLETPVPNTPPVPQTSQAEVPKPEQPIPIPPQNEPPVPQPAQPEAPKPNIDPIQSNQPPKNP